MANVAGLVPLFGTIGLLSLLLSGCATSEHVDSNADPSYSGMVSAREYGYVRPAVDVVVAERGGVPRSGRPSPSGDLWTRVRSGLRLDLHANQRIDTTVERFRRDPRYLERMAQRATPYIHVIVNEIERRDLPMELAFLPHVESRFNPTATSPKSAAGIWQFMPYTGREMGLRQDTWYDGRRDLLASTGAALDYLEQLNRRFDGDWALTMAAYNCGPGCVAAAQAANRREGRPTDFWSLSLPEETRQYVPQILATARLVANPQGHGTPLPIVPDRPQLEMLRTERSLDLQRVATVTGVQLSELQRLNPAYKLGRTSPDGPSHILIPAGTGERARKQIDGAQIMPALAHLAAPGSSTSARSSRLDRAHVRVHTVKSGETLKTIARQQGVDATNLAKANGLNPHDQLRAGQRIKIQSSGAGQPITHRVEKGDSIKKLARRYGVTVKEIQRWNHLSDDRINMDELILIYPRGSGSSRS